MSRTSEPAKFLDCQEEDLKQGWDEQTFELGDKEYLVLTDEEADARTREYIESSVWAFRPEWLAEFLGLPYEAVEMIESFTIAKCEDANETILALIEHGDGIDEFVDEAISADGRGHFLSHYDGDEHETENYYIYRTN